MSFRLIYNFVINTDKIFIKNTFSCQKNTQKMNNNNKIVVIGSTMIDFVCYTDNLPKPGETIFGTKFSTNFGGKGSNQCVAASKLGGNTLMVARVGDDSWGENYLKNFKDLHVDCKYVQKTPNFTSGIAQITVSNLTAENQIVIVPGANTQLNENDVVLAKEEIENASVIVCQLETPIEVALKAMKLTKGLSILNGAPAISNYPIELLTLPSIFCVNETEAEIFSNLPVTTIDEAKIAAKKFIELGCKTVIITLGNKGSVYATKNQEAEHLGCPTVQAVDTTGAGDAFIGALAYFLASKPDLSIKEAILGASFVAAKSTTLPGTQISYPNREILREYELLSKIK